MKKPGSYRIELDGRWEFEEFYALPHTFNQVYAFHYAFDPDTEVNDPYVFESAFVSYPWRGGYSAVNFYRTLFGQIVRSGRPEIISIEYASPGHIDLQLIVDAAKAVGAVVGVFTGSAFSMNKLYNAIYRGARDRELLRMRQQQARLQLNKSQLDFVLQSSKELAEALKFKKLEELEQLTENHLSTLKILMSYFRRVAILSEFQANKKAKFLK